MQFDQSRRRKPITLRGGTVAAWPLTARVAADADDRLVETAKPNRCNRGAEARRFDRLLIDAGLIKGL
jgi:hypothetical protein